MWAYVGLFFGSLVLIAAYYAYKGLMVSRDQAVFMKELGAKMTIEERFPVDWTAREEFFAAAKSTNDPRQLSSALGKRCVQLVRMFHPVQTARQQMTKDFKAGFMPEPEYAKFIQLFNQLAKETEEIGQTAEQMHPGFGQQVFQMARHVVYQEQNAKAAASNEQGETEIERKDRLERQARIHRERHEQAQKTAEEQKKQAEREAQQAAQKEANDKIKQAQRLQKELIREEEQAKTKEAQKNKTAATQRKK
eukprot:GFYU01004223.1.p1 GENE.GFYU01004223.1~~GFYU01004223.1.p1  ORF type:complete len:268 (+),score=79.57 GFYU01004223.1:55-804(+)